MFVCANGWNVHDGPRHMLLGCWCCCWQTEGEQINLWTRVKVAWQHDFWVALNPMWGRNQRLHQERFLSRHLYKPRTLNKMKRAWFKHAFLPDISFNAIKHRVSRQMLCCSICIRPGRCAHQCTSAISFCQYSTRLPTHNDSRHSIAQSSQLEYDVGER